METTLGLNPLELFAGGSITIWALIAIWDRFFSKRAKDLKEADATLLGLHKETITTLTTEKKALEDLLHKKDQVEAKLTGENNTLREVLQGRDHETIEYRKAALQAMNETKQVLTLTKGLYEMVQNSAKISEANSDAVRTLAEMLGRQLGLDVPKRAPQFDTTKKTDLSRDVKMG